jgi:sec-independent protein translocase protein TatA
MLLIAFVAVLLFGAGRIADIGKGIGEGIKNFKKGIKDDPNEPDQLLAQTFNEGDDQDDQRKPARRKPAKA